MRLPLALSLQEVPMFGIPFGNEPRTWAPPGPTPTSTAARKSSRIVMGAERRACPAAASLPSALIRPR